MSALDAEMTHVPAPLPAMTRWPGLDWLRAGAAVLVVMLHAGIAYLVVRMPGLAWSTHDPAGSPFVDAVSWWINGFIMPLFFVQSGFLAHRVMRAKGPREFLIHRSRRLLIPLGLGCVLILPLDFYVWLLGWAAEGKIPLRKLRSLKIGSPLEDHLWGVSHLWFLEYLWVFCVVAWLVCRVSHGLSSRPGVDASFPCVTEPRRNGRWAIATVALMTASGIALWWEPQILIGFRHSWWPLPANLMFYGPWFALGWLVHARPQVSWRAADVSPPMAAGQLSHPSSRGVISSITGVYQTVSVAETHVATTQPWDASGDSRPPLAGSASRVEVASFRDAPAPPFATLCAWRVAVAIGLFSILLSLIHRHVSEGTAGSERIVLVSLFVLHAWLMVTGLFGVSLRWLNRHPPKAVMYVAEASFWIYLFHHPVVGLTQVTLSPLAISAVTKFAVTIAIGLTLPLLTYQAFVRRTWVGALLNGQPLRGARRASAADVLPLPAPAAERLRKSA